VYTQCSKCATIFKLSAETLRAASGQVRCGKCGEIFNALSNLAEDRSAFITGESPLALERRADSILESPPAEPPTSPPPAPPAEPAPAANGVETARLELADSEIADFSFGNDDPEESAQVVPEPPAAQSNAAGETSMEFTLPPGELDRIFVEPKLTPLPFTPIPETEPELPPHPESAEARVAGIDLSDDARAQMLGGAEPPSIDGLVRRKRIVRPGVWPGAAIVLGLLLVIQVVHNNREFLAAHGPLAPLLRALYSSAGAPISAAANLSIYELRQWGVTGDPAAEGTLRVRASIMNTAPQFEPYPLLRVTLANRFGTRIGMRDFDAAEYTGKPVAALLKPGERVDATMSIRDPGTDAEGFEIDVCLRASDKHITCASEVNAVQTKR
jgi:predicted Zn finger-like uncharacterized protein